jgi:hypothetical protein
MGLTSLEVSANHIPQGITDARKQRCGALLLLLLFNSGLDLIVVVAWHQLKLCVAKARPIAAADLDFSPHRHRLHAGTKSIKKTSCHIDCNQAEHNHWMQLHARLTVHLPLQRRRAGTDSYSAAFPSSLQHS